MFLDICWEAWGRFWGVVWQDKCPIAFQWLQGLFKNKEACPSSGDFGGIFGGYVGNMLGDMWGIGGGNLEESLRKFVGTLGEIWRNLRGD